MTGTQKVLSSFRRYWRPLAGLLLGGAAGFGYYALIGCHGGSCPLLGNPWTASMAGAAAGSLIIGKS